MCHSRASGNPDRTGSPIRSASLSVEDDKGCVIPAFFLSFPHPFRHSRASGNPVRMDPQSETIAKREDPLHLFRNKPHIGLTIHIKLHIDLQNLTIVDAIISDIIGIASQADIDHILRRDRRGN